VEFGRRPPYFSAICIILAFRQARAQSHRYTERRRALSLDQRSQLVNPWNSARCCPYFQSLYALARARAPRLESHSPGLTQQVQEMPRCRSVEGIRLGAKVTPPRLGLAARQHAEKAYKQRVFRISPKSVARRAFCNPRLQKAAHVENTIWCNVFRYGARCMGIGDASRRTSYWPPLVLPEPSYLSGRPAEGSRPNLTRRPNIQIERVARMEHVARIDGEPAHILLLAIKRQKTDPRRTLGIPAERETAAFEKCLWRERDGQIEDHDASRSDRAIVNHRYIGNRCEGHNSFHATSRIDHDVVHLPGVIADRVQLAGRRIEMRMGAVRKRQVAIEQAFECS
jgi:hypothetical protein